MTYNGSPWRSRFLRSPKLGIELAARDDFVALGDVATLRLGMKTGADKFFFLNVVSRSGNKITATGLNGFEGEFNAADLIPAIQTPKELDTTNGRLAVVPTARGRYSGPSFYFAPRRRLDATAKAYVEWGELQTIHQQRLVRDNADGDDWFRQSRGRVASRWCLPYNSGYDYSAVDNRIGALLNGRLVGVEPNVDVDADLLGAVLNSTVVTLMRLLEGVTTGNEGAFDVGPPSARVMRVPDPRKMQDTLDVTAALDAIRRHGTIPDAPSRDGDVSTLRRNLDVAVLASLGMTRGEAVVLAERIYAAYARWRAAVEDVEGKMQVHRRALARRGGTRTQNPIQRTANTVWDEIHLTVPCLFERLASATECDVVDPIIRDEGEPQDALFGGTTFPTPAGDTVDLVDQRRADLARKVREYGYSGPFPLPRSAVEAQNARDHILVTEASVRADVERRAHTYLSADLVAQAVEQVMLKWHGMSIAALRQTLTDGNDVEVNGPDLFQTEGLVPPPGEDPPATSSSPSSVDSAQESAE